MSPAESLEQGRNASWRLNSIYCCIVIKALFILWNNVPNALFLNLLNLILLYSIIIYKKNYFYISLTVFGCSYLSRQRGRKGKSIVFTTTLIAWSGCNPHSGHVVASFDYILYDDDLYLVDSNKQQIQWTRMQRKQRDIGSLETCKWVWILQNEVVNCNKKCANCQIAPDAARWQKDKYAVQQEQTSSKTSVQRHFTEAIFISNHVICLII